MEKTFIEYKQSILSSTNDVVKSTNIACWHCTHTFKHAPKTVPVNYNKTKHTFEVVGVFCSWGCAKTWMSTRVEYNTPIKRMWLYEMARKHYGYDEDVIYPAPDPWVLKKFGGSLSIEEFRQMSKMDYNETIRPPLLPACMAFVHGTTSKVTRSLAATRNDEGVKKEQSGSNEKEGMYHNFLSEQEVKGQSCSVENKTKVVAKKKEKKDPPIVKRRLRSSLQTFMKRTGT